MRTSNFSLQSVAVSWSVLTVMVEIKWPKWRSKRSAWTNVNWPELSSDSHAKLTAEYMTSKYFWAANFSCLQTSLTTQMSFNDKWLNTSNKHVSFRFLKYASGFREHADHNRTINNRISETTRNRSLTLCIFDYLPFVTSYNAGGTQGTVGARTGIGQTFGRIAVLVEVVLVGTLQTFFASLFSISSRRNFRLLLLFSVGLELRLRHGLESGLVSGVRLSTLTVSGCRAMIVRIKPYLFLLMHKSKAPTLGRNEYRDDFTFNADDIILKQNECSKITQ